MTQLSSCPICQQPAATPKFRPFCSDECSDIDLDRVRDELTAGLEQLAENLMGGPPSIKKPSVWRWGSKGAFVLQMRGSKRGVWHDKESEKGGGPFHLIAHCRSCSMGEAIKWARDWTGNTPDAGHDFKAERAARKAERDRKARESEAADARDTARRAETAGRMWAQAAPLAGTLGERYLVEVRGVPAPGVWPDCIRFHPPTRSLMVAATLSDGTLRAVQRVHLTPQAGKAEPTLERPTKVTNGHGAGAAVRLLARDGGLGPLLLAEGPETGLSVWAATGHETWIALGGMGSLVLPADRQIVACRDDDPKHSPGDKKMTRVVEEWRSGGHAVAVATPWPFRAYDKTDFNDVLKRDDVGAIQRRVDAALNPGGGTPIRLPIKEVRERLRKAVGGFFDQVRVHDERLPPVAGLDGSLADAMESWDFLDRPAPLAAPPVPIPVHAIRVDVGSGKTVAAMGESIRLLSEMRAAGDARTAAFAIPTHALGDELAAIFSVHPSRSHLTAAVWRGMSANDPDNPGNPMCLNLDAVQDARDASLDVFTTTCRRKLRDGTVVECPFFKTCGYQRQRESQADLWIVPHEMLFMEKPGTIGKLAFVVVDEAVWQDGLDGVHGRPTALPLDALDHMESLPANAGSRMRDDRERLIFLRNRLLDVVRPAAEGPVTAEAVEQSDLSLDNTREAYRLEWARFIDPNMHPGMTKAERREAVMRAAVNATIPRLASVWKAMTALLEDGGPSRSGWAAVAMQAERDGLVKVLHLKGRREVRKGWLVPTLLIDATMDVNLVRPYWPNVEMTAELLADAPYQTVRQVVDRAYSKSAIEPMTTDQLGYTEAEAKRRVKGLRNVHAIVNREARSYGQAPVLLVTQKAVREAMPEHGPMAPCIDLAHHNAVAGRDQWRGVRALIVVGRTQPAPASVERLAEALTGRAVDHIDGWYARGDGVRHTAAAGAVAIEADRHPDPIAEAIRWQVCEGELVQIIGRGRGVNRTEDNPLDVLVLTDAPLPIPVTATLQAAELAPSPDDLMLAAGGVVLENAADAAAAYPHIWATRNAANHTFKRWRAEHPTTAEVGAIPLIIDSIRSLAPTSLGLSRIAYQAKGAGKSASVAWCDPAVVADPAAWLTTHIGPLAWCQAGEEPDPPSAPGGRRESTPLVLPSGMPPGVASVCGAAAAELVTLDASPSSAPGHAAMELDAMLADVSSHPIHTGLDPASIYARGALVPPVADSWVIATRDGLTIRLQERPSLDVTVPRSRLLWTWPASRPGAIGTGLVPEKTLQPALCEHG